MTILPEMSVGDASLLKSTEKNLDFWWQQFVSEFPLEEDCLRELYKRTVASNATPTCQYCGCGKLVTRRRYRVLKCESCKRDTWLTAGTFFHRIRRARAWLAAIWLMERGVIVNSSRFHKLVGIAYSTAFTMLKKITLVIDSQMQDAAVTVGSGVFSTVICKRSRETPARAHPADELAVIECRLVANNESASQSADEPGLDLFTSTFAGSTAESEPTPCQEKAIQALRISTDEGEFDEWQTKVHDCLSQTPSSFDSLCERAGMPAGQLSATLMMLELAGVAQCLPGNHYIRCLVQSPKSAVPLSAQTAKVVDSIMDFVRSGFHGISCKFLQHYLAAHWCYIDRVRWAPGSLLNACLRFRYVPYAEILSSVSVPTVRLLSYQSL